MGARQRQTFCFADGWFRALYASTMAGFTHSHRIRDGLQLALGNTKRKQAALQQCWVENAVRAGTNRGFDTGQDDLPLVPRLDIRRRAEAGGEGCGG